MLQHSAQSGSHSLADRGPDFYATPPEAVRPLLRVAKLPRRIWEPACGSGAIVQVLRDAGHIVHASDLFAWGCPDSSSGIDFLQQSSAPAGTNCVVTNPPFKFAQQFAEHALQLVPYVALLLRLAFLESERRSSLLDRGQLVRVHVFKNRLPFMHRHDWQGPRAGNAIPFAWFCWSRKHKGPATIDRISWKDCEEK